MSHRPTSGPAYLGRGWSGLSLLCKEEAVKLQVEHSSVTAARGGLSPTPGDQPICA